jgi:4-aminobutyrate aminotransferase
VAKKWIHRKRQCIARSFDGRFPTLVISKTEGSYVMDVDGNAYLDFTSGAHCCNIGHSNPSVVAAIRKQISRSISSYPHVQPIQVELAEKLREMAPGKLTQGMVNFCNTGTDATELSMKMSRAYTRRVGFVAYMGSFHGKSFGALSLTAASSDLRYRHLPLLPEIRHVPYPYCYRCFFGSEYPSCNLRCIAYIERLFETTIHPESIAALFIEPIQWHGGVLVPPADYFKRIRRLCSTYGILLVDDEVATGFGRTGGIFGIDNWGVEPDVLYMGKPIAGGMPLGAVIAKKEVMDVSTTAGTFSGHPVSCAAALAHINMIQEQKLCSHARKIGRFMIQRLKEMSEICGVIGDIRGKGMMLGVELVRDTKSKVPTPNKANAVIKRALKNGLLLLPAGLYNNVLRISPPLTATKEEVDEGLNVLETLFHNIEK